MISVASLHRSRRRKMVQGNEQASEEKGLRSAGSVAPSTSAAFQTEMQARRIRTGRSIPADEFSKSVEEEYKRRRSLSRPPCISRWPPPVYSFLHIIDAVNPRESSLFLSVSCWYRQRPVARLSDAQLSQRLVRHFPHKQNPPSLCFNSPFYARISG